MNRPSKQTVNRQIHALIAGILTSFFLLAAALALDILIFGWGRFMSDFWPLDESRIGPNLVASFVIVVGVVAHNEGRVVQKDVERHAGYRQTVFDALQEVLHPTETAEEAIARIVSEKGTEDPLGGPSGENASEDAQ